MEIEELKKRLVEALKDRNWCPCCGYCGMWPPGSQQEKEWEDFLDKALVESHLASPGDVRE